MAISVESYAIKRVLHAPVDLERGLYYTAFAMYFVSYSLSYTMFEIDYVITGVQLAALFLLAVKLLLQRYRVWQPLVILAIVGIAFLSWMASDDKSLVFLVAFVFAGQRIDIKTLAKIALYCELGVLLVVVGANLTGIIPSVFEYRENGFARNSFGFSHPNRFGSALLVIVAADAVLSYPRYGLRNIGLAVIALLANRWICDSRGPMVATVILCALMLILKKIDSRLTYIGKVLGLALISVVAVIVFSFYCTFCYDRTNSWMLAFNNLLSGRLELASYYWRIYPPTLFGQSFEDARTFLNSFQSVIIDNAYIRVIMVFGIIPGVLYILSLLALFIFIYKKRILSLWVILVFVYTVYGFFESQSIHFAVNYGLIGLSGLFYSSFFYSSKRLRDSQRIYQHAV